MPFSSAHAKYAVLPYLPTSRNASNPVCSILPKPVERLYDSYVFCESPDAPRRSAAPANRSKPLMAASCGVPPTSTGPEGSTSASATVLPLSTNASSPSCSMSAARTLVTDGPTATYASSSPAAAVRTVNTPNFARPSRTVRCAATVMVWCPPAAAPSPPARTTYASA